MTTQAQTESALRPVTKAARIDSLDILRGVAVLGILLMNITGFGLLPHAYGNPLADGGGTGINLATYQTTTILFEGTMRGIFSLLFGASIVLLTERMEQSGAGLDTAEIYFRRMFWMLVFGFIHWSLLLWYGEILFAYAMCGFVLFAFRKIAAKWQLALAALLLLGAAGFQAQSYQEAATMQASANDALAAKDAGQKLSKEQASAIEDWNGLREHFYPTEEAAKAVRKIHNVGYWQAVTGQFDSSYQFQWTEAPFWLIFDMSSFMLIGMGLLKLGVLSASRSRRFYLTLMVAGYGIGVPLGLYELNLILASGFEVMGFKSADITYQFSRLAMVCGHLGLILLFIKSGLLGFLQRALAATGQMALSNYLAQTLICVTLFYGFGFALFGKLERHELYIIVAAIWVAELIWSPIWLRHFRFGPFEWLWRSLTYWQRQPMKVG
ncbi:DUF418 domain-containing protein [uncultured Sphingorhabdus sp.]|uniref:DUF418 domain-containing protein n=1 Tax=uncultured Sphingorhabdus sp. TaxID=1686106 RepID=UPI00261C7648|nr:DUF418 domain-containing protein [uncultured Sphingorhabdus sp.]HMS19632.1 DUF418 domain-containing protein [Sphingorhabdus sp.]